ncbi:unnamed protein product [Rotaria magnacalcarata]|uniref:SWIM-type domain-containing protein n=1 Tax=Rotaria magnacalcarata TaxID=392030 RepID=A0A816VIZ7_9BILA|nr:unnamed protein product [Rotaria magnacalcarata]CAF4191285.1 unnamed protein product [Rotaria magnacalcarata]
MEVTQKVAQYISESSDEEVDTDNNDLQRNKKIKKRQARYWVKEAEFSNAGEAQASVEIIRSKHYTNYSEIGRRVHYRCKKAKHRGRQCRASMHLLYHADSDKVSMYKTEVDHDHEERQVHGINENVKKSIDDLFNDGIMKPKQIIRALQARKIATPSIIQIKNYLAQFKKKKFGSYMISLGELEDWCKRNLNIPVDENKSFVVWYQIMYEGEEYDDEDDVEDNDGNKFRIFISSVRLLNIASISSHINADATYKLIWQGYPVLIIGTTDLNKVFHPFGLAICSNEKTKDFQFIFNSIQIGMQKIKKELLKPTALVADAAGAIKGGFKNVFNNEYSQIMCWSRMKTKVENHACHIDNKDVAKEIIDDIELLHLSNSTAVFKLALTLFFKKWKINNKQKNQSIIDFLNYFDTEWIQSNNGWYEGIQLYTPSTNNALEATNRVIKDDGTFRERHVLSRFLTISFTIINNWSIERDLSSSSTNAKAFATEPTICLQLWTSSYQWAKTIQDIICIQNDISKQYYIPARNLESISQIELKKYINKNWTTFNQFKKSYDIWCLEMQDDSNWKTSKCNCPAFLKNYICKHIVGMAIRLKYCKPPAAAKTVPINSKRKRGSPAKAKPALLVQ